MRGETSSAEELLARIIHRAAPDDGATLPDDLAALAVRRAI